MFSQTPFKILASPGNENDSSVLKTTSKGSKTVDFPRKKGLSAFPETAKNTGLSTVVKKSTRKPLGEISSNRTILDRNDNKASGTEKIESIPLQVTKVAATKFDTVSY
jgi:hypothetical protein